MSGTLTSPAPLTREAPPAAAGVPASRRSFIERIPLLWAGRALMALGAGLALFIAFELTLSGLIEQQAQQSLLSQFKTNIITTTLDRPATTPAEGSAVAILEIPRLGVQQVVVEGTTPADLKSGPGHLRGSPIPGEFGNSVIAGRRLTYGGPFGRLPSMRTGDAIRVTTGQGLFTYVVTSVGHVGEGQPDPVLGTSDSRLTLITSDPAFVASGRLVVKAKLQGRPAAVATRAPALVGSSELGLDGDSLGLGLGIIWGELLLAALWLAWRWRNRWPAVVVYLIATPVVLALAVLTFTSFDLLLPGTL